MRCLVRDRGRAHALAEGGMELHEGDVLKPETLRGAGQGIDVAYYLVHAMGRSGGRDFERQERVAAESFARVAAEEGVGRVVYLGGLGDRPGSRHLRSRHRTAQILARLGPPLTYFRAGMVVGARSESYRTLRYLVQRLPAMIAPAWLATPTQPIGIDDVVAYLAAAPDVAASAGREVQIGGPDVLSYGDMLDRMADALGVRRRPRVPFPLLTPWLSSLWIGLVTPVDARIARPLIEGLGTRTTVTDPSGAQLFDIEPVSFAEALRRALADDPEAPTPRNANAVRLLPERLEKVPRTGAVGSEQAGELSLPGSASAILSRDFLSAAARGYWSYLARISLGLIRVGYESDHQSVALVAARLVLIRFRPPEYELGRGHGSVTWPIERGVLVARDGRGRGFLRLTVESAGDAGEGGRIPVRVRMEVRNFYPWLRGRGRFARFGGWLYGLTQQRIHRRVTRGFLRSLAALERPPRGGGTV